MPLRCSPESPSMICRLGTTSSSSTRGAGCVSSSAIGREHSRTSCKREARLSRSRSTIPPTCPGAHRRRSLCISSDGPKRHERSRGRNSHSRERWGAPRTVGISLRALGLVEGGQAGEQLLREAVEVLADSPARLEHARALVDLGALLRRDNRRSEARKLLREGVDLAHQCGATALVTRGNDELAATGAHPRTILLSGLDRLTQRVVRRGSFCARESSWRSNAVRPPWSHKGTTNSRRPARIAARFCAAGSTNSRRASGGLRRWPPKS